MSGGVSSSSLSRVLQPVVFGDESLRVLEAGHRPFGVESVRPQDSIQDGDSSVCPFVSAEGRLDGVSRLEGRLLASSYPSGQSQVPQICSLQLGVPIQGSVLWSLHGFSSFHEGHGSGIDFFASCGHSDLSIPRRLVDPGFLSISHSPGSGDGALSVSEF